MQDKNSPGKGQAAVAGESGSSGESPDQAMFKHIEELNRKQQNIYPLINRMRQRIERQRHIVTRIGV